MSLPHTAPSPCATLQPQQHPAPPLALADLKEAGVNLKQEQQCWKGQTSGVTQPREGKSPIKHLQPRAFATSAVNRELNKRVGVWPSGRALV